MLFGRPPDHRFTFEVVRRNRPIRETPIRPSYHHPGAGESLSLEDHTRDFMHLVPHTHYPDSCLCTFYRVGLNPTIKAQLSGEGPRESIADYIEWVLASCRSSWTVGIVEKDVSPTQDPEPSQPSPRHAEYEPEPTADDEPEPRATEQRIATEPEPNTSDQVREPAKTTVKVECCVEQERAMESPAHCTTAGPLCSPSAHYLCSGLAAGLPASIGVRAGGSLISASSLRVQNSASALRPCGSTTALSALVSIVAHQSTSSTGLPRLSGSALVGRRPFITSGLCSYGCASSLRPTGSVDLLPPSGTAFILCRSGSAADLWISAYASVARASGSALALRNLGVALDLRLSVSASGSSASCSASVGRPPGVVSPSSTMAPPSIGSTVGHHGCGLGLPLLLLLRVPPVSSLAPPTFVAPLDSVDSGFCPPSGVPSSAEASSPMDSGFSVFSPPSLFCFVLFSTARGRAYSEGGVMLQFCLFVLLVSPIVSPR
ncbi:Zinc metalloprotease ZmpB [Labeo rohita]|uniref:Zinc metalloprotease ZmpB n=1 Tax=Labeo rohita TaxID=84645 RepID=A0ABQ8L6S3_LABRO|nr:Zinc metalloprotease ZmpB [Labeo rohita]